MKTIVSVDCDTLGQPEDSWARRRRSGAWSGCVTAAVISFILTSKRESYGLHALHSAAPCLLRGDQSHRPMTVKLPRRILLHEYRFYALNLRCYACCMTVQTSTVTNMDKSGAGRERFSPSANKWAGLTGPSRTRARTHACTRSFA